MTGARNKFPQSGTFNEQKGSPIVTSIEKSQAPFSVKAADIPNGVSVDVFHHAVTKSNNNAASATENDSDDDNDDSVKQQSTDAMVTRRLIVSSTKTKEKITLRLPDSGKTYTLQFNADGSVKKVTTAQQPLSQQAVGLEKQPGIVVKAVDTTRGREMFTAFNQNCDQEQTSTKKFNK
jgi:hypothetical protein